MVSNESAPNDKQEKEKEAVARRRARRRLPRLVCSFPSVVSDVTFVRESTLPEWVPVPRCTSPPFSSTSVLRSSSSLATLPVTTRRPVSFRVTLPLPLRMTRSSTSSWEESRLHLEVCCQTFTLSFSPRSRPSRCSASRVFSISGLTQHKTGFSQNHQLHKDLSHFSSFLPDSLPWSLFELVSLSNIGVLITK